MKTITEKIILWPMVILLLLLAIDIYAEDGKGSEPGDYALGASSIRESVECPESSAIKDSTQKVMSRPEFRDILGQENSFWRKVIDFLDKLFGDREPGEHSGLANFLVWVLIIWCVITMLAILAHFIWALYITIHTGSANRKAFGVDGDFAENTYRMSVKDLLLEMEKSLAAKDYARALSFLTASLLKRLESFEYIIVHPSKTNGDYLRECGRGSIIFNKFRQYIIGFESVAYGFKGCDELYFRNMYSAYEQIERECEQAN